MKNQKPQTKEYGLNGRKTSQLPCNDLLCGIYRTILIDPPWPQRMMPKLKDSRPGRIKGTGNARKLPYGTMAIEGIAALPVGELAADDAHLWLWTTNQFLHDGFHLLEAWGFRYMAPITWVKPSGCGAWWVHRTQTMLFGFRGKLDMKTRLRMTVQEMPTPRRHSEKPEASYELIEAISHEPRVELFARPWSPLFPTRDGWDVWGHEVKSNVTFAT